MIIKHTIKMIYRYLALLNNDIFSRFVLCLYFRLHTGQPRVCLVQPSLHGLQPSHTTRHEHLTNHLRAVQFGT